MSLVVLAVIPWLVSTIYHSVDEHHSAIDRERQSAVHFTRLVALDQEEILKHSKVLLEALSVLPGMRDATATECKSLMAKMLGRFPGQYVNIGIADARGTLLCDVLGTQRAIRYDDRRWFRDALKSRRFAMGDLVNSRTTGKPVIVAALPLMDTRGEVSRIIFAAIDIEWIKQLLHRIKVPDGAVIEIMDARGAIVASHSGTGSTIRTLPAKTLIQSIREQQEQGSGEALGPDGAHQLYAFHRLLGDAAGGVYLGIHFPTKGVVAKSDRVFVRDMAILVLTVCVVFILVWYGTHVLVLRKTQALIQSAQQIARGNFSVRTGLGKGLDELSALARVFDDMAESVEILFQQSRNIMEVAPEAIFITDGAGRISMVNAHVERIFGYRRDNLIGVQSDLLIAEHCRAAYNSERKTYAKLGSPEIKEIRPSDSLLGRKKDGSEFAIEISFGPLNTKDGSFVICAVRDVSERKRFEERIVHQATHDTLTGLPNRIFFHEILVQATARAQRTEKLMAVLFLDLDGFKNINDTLGHEYGDILLKEVASRLTAILRRDDLVSRGESLVTRQGGDEFTILLQGITVVENIIQIAEKILNAIAAPVVADGHEMHVTASIGITVYPFDDADIEKLLRNADMAMYRAKETGRNKFEFYTASMNTMVRERMEIENGLRHALARNELVLHYQPQVELDRGDFVAIEALVRWAHPEKGLIPPSKFIPVAEESGLIVPIGEWILRTACRQLKTWHDAGFPQLRMAVNLSARQFRQPNLRALVAQILRETGLEKHAHLLELEITESLLMKDMEETIAIMHAFHDMGVRLAIDDFGTGYSSLSYIKRFPIHSLKIDRSFVTDITEDAKDAAIAGTIVTLAHNLGLTVIAEGVETGKQLALLRNIGCDEVQGYYFSKPLPPSDLEKLLRDKQSASCCMVG